MRFGVVVLFSTGLSFAGTWSGTLVDARCWMFEESNVSPRHTTQFVDRDRNREVSYCSPGKKTKTFAIVPPDGVSLDLDAAGNAQAADLVRSSGTKSAMRVIVTGEIQKNLIQVSSIAVAK